jgi:hypothetical protein
MYHKREEEEIHPFSHFYRPRKQRRHVQLDAHRYGLDSPVVRSARIYGRYAHSVENMCIFTSVFNLVEEDKTWLPLLPHAYKEV